MLAEHFVVVEGWVVAACLVESFLDPWLVDFALAVVGSCFVVVVVMGIEYTAVDSVLVVVVDS